MRSKPILIDRENNFELFIFQPIYKEKSCSNKAYFRNTKTGEDCGQNVVLCEYRYNNDGTPSKEYKLDEDVYELVLKSESIKEEEKTNE